MDATRSDGEPTDLTTPVVYKPIDGFRRRNISTSVGIIVTCMLLLIPAASSGAAVGIGVLSLIVVVLAVDLWGYLRCRTTITAAELIVQGRFASVRVPLSAVTAVHHEETGGRVDRQRLVVWVAATGQRPFRIYQLVGHPTFVADLRRRAASCGAAVDVEAGDLAPAPAGTRMFFTLF